MALKKEVHVETIIRELAKKLWSDAQIAAVTKVHRSTIERRYAHLIKDARHEGSADLMEELRQRAKVSDKLFEVYLDRTLGPIPRKINVAMLRMLSKEEKKEALSELVASLEGDDNTEE